MTENDIKELISKNFIRTIANRNGYKVGERDLDHGVDLNLIEVSKRINRDGSTRYLDSGKHVDLQLKSTTENSVRYLEDTVKYSLEVKNYNDLIQRRKGIYPLFLVVLILPSEGDNWVVCDETMLKIEKHAYWYLPEPSDVESDNSVSVTIELSKSNLIDLDAIEELFKITYS